MKITNLIFFLAVITLANCASLNASVEDFYLPKETLLLKLPDNESENWKPIARHAATMQGIVEYIPSKQVKENWEDLIAFQYFEVSKKFSRKNPIDEILSLLKKTTIDKYPGSKVTWNVIEKKQGEAIYEWILHSQHGKIPPQHEIVRIFYRNNFVHRIGFTHLNEVINSDLRSKWIQLLSESVSFISPKDLTVQPKDLSLIVRFSDLIDSGPDFSDWKVINNLVLENNVTSFTLIPPDHNEAYITECIDIMTMPLGPHNKLSTTDKLFQLEEKLIATKFSKKPKIQILEKSTGEINFTYQSTVNNILVTNVARALMTPFHYLSIHYKKGLFPLTEEEILMKKKQLEAFKNKSN